MAARLRYILTIGISSSTAEDNDLGKGKADQVTDGYNEGGSWTTLVAKLTTDVQLQMPNIASVAFLAIRTVSRDTTLSPVQISIKRNSTLGEAIPITPLTGTKEGIFMISTSGLTSLFATNASATTDMDVRVYALGD